MANKPGQTDLRETLSHCKSSFIAVGVFSLFVNLLMLTPAFYMLQVYDRVIPSGSYATLIMLTLIMLLMFLTLGGLEWVRGQILVRVGTRLESILDTRLFDASFKQALYSGGANATGQTLSDLSGIRQFISGNGLFAFFDAPWLPVYLFVMFLFHPLFGWVGVISAALLLLMALLNERTTREPLAQASRAAVASNTFVLNNLRNAEVIESMGMLGDIRQRWQHKHHRTLALQAHANSRAGTLSAISRIFRLTVQSMILGLGAYLVIQQVITPGLMIAGSILLGRALAPVDMLISSWRQFAQARGQYQRLNQLLTRVPENSRRMSLPPPQGVVTAENVSMAPPASKTLVLKNLSFRIEQGDIVGVIGPSASGKTTLARGILGIWPAVSGKFRLDGAAVFDLDRQELGPHVGYLPQDIELFEGSVSENIARFGEIDPEKVVTAAKLTGVHDMILRLPQGYDTRVGAAGSSLSAGQRQRVALARALYGAPGLVVLDEPNSNLDDQGELALVTALNRLKQQGATVIVISHRKSIVAGVDKLMVIREGTLFMYGPKEEVLAGMNANIASFRARERRADSEGPH